MDETLKSETIPEKPAPKAEKKEKQPVVWGKRDTIALIFGAALSILWFRVYGFAAMLEGGPGLGVTLFQVLFLIGGSLCVKKGSPLTFSVKILLGASLLLALTCVLHSTYWLNLINAVISIALGLMGLMIWSGRTRAMWDSFSAVTESFVLTLSGMFSHYFRPFSALTNRKPMGKKARGRFLGVVCGILAAGAMLIIVVPLLSSADEVFADMTLGFMIKVKDFFDDMFSGQSLAWIYKTLRFLLLALPLYSLLKSLGDGHRQPGEPMFRWFPRMEQAVIPAVVFLAALNVVYAVFVFIQFTYLFGNVEIAVMSGGFAEYARSGFFQLVKVSALNLGVLLLAARILPTLKEGGRLPRYLAIVLIVFTAVILASALYRMCLYVSVYSLSVKRFLTLWAMALIAVSLIATGVKLIRDDFPLYTTLFAAVLVFWIGLSAMNFEARVANYNVDAYLEGKVETIDIAYLARSLSDSAVPALLDLEQARGREGIDWDHYDSLVAEVTDMLAYRTPTWRSWTISTARACELMGVDRDA